MLVRPSRKNKAAGHYLQIVTSQPANLNYVSFPDIQLRKPNPPLNSDPRRFLIRTNFYSSSDQRLPLCCPIFHRLALEAALGELVPTADYEAHHQIGLSGGLGLG